MALLQGYVQPAVPTARGAGPENIMQLQLGEIGVSEVLPRYGALGWSGQLYYASNTGAQALSVASATFTGLAVGNPAGSGKNLMIIDASFALGAVVAAVSAVAIGWAPIVALTTGSSTGPKGAPTLVGTSGGSVANVGASATLGAAPTVIRPILGIDWVTGGTPVAQVAAKDEIAGTILIPPGQLICMEALVAAVTGICSFTWAELPI
jgi:hypothetical protein